MASESKREESSVPTTERAAGGAGGSPTSSGIEATVGGFRFGESGAGAAYYLIEVKDTDHGKAWTTYRRFKEFDELHHTLKHCPSCQDSFSAALPPKRWFNKSPAVLEERRLGLATYLEALSAIPAVSTHPSFIDFLAPRTDDAVPSAIKKDDGKTVTADEAWAATRAEFMGKLTELEAADAPANEVALALLDFGRRARLFGKKDEAEKQFQEALAKLSAVGAERSREGSLAHGCLGTLYHSDRRFTDAGAQLELALNIQEELGLEELVAETLVNLGCVAEGQAIHSRAEECYERALGIQERVLGDHHDTAATLSNLGYLYQNLRKFDKAEECLKRAVNILQRLARGSGDSDLCSHCATALYNLGNQYKKQKRLEEAEDCYRRALHAMEEGFSAESLEVATACNNLGNLLKKQGGDKLNDAEVVYRRCLGIRQSLLGNAPDTGNAAFNLGLLLSMTDDLAGAEASFSQALRIFTSASMDKQASSATRYLRAVQEKRRVLYKPATQLTHK